MDIETQDAVFGIHIGVPCEGIQAALGEQFQRQCNLPGLLFRLLQKLLMEVGQRRRIAGIVAGNVALIDRRNTAVNQGFLSCGQPTTTNCHFTQRQDEFGFQQYRIFLIAVIAGNVHGVDMMPGGCRDADHLAAHSLRNHCVLALRVDDDNIVIGAGGDGYDLLLGEEGLARTGYAHKKSVAVEQALSVYGDQVLGDDVPAVANAAGSEHLLGIEGHEDGSGFGGHGAQGIGSANTIGKRRVQAVRLLITQRRHLAKMLPTHRHERFRIAVQFLLGIGHMYQRHRNQHHALVAGGQVLQELLGFFLLKLHLIGHYADTGRI